MELVRRKRKISSDNPCLLRLKKRREMLSSLKRDLEILSWKTFRLHREEQVARQFIVEPIIESLIDAASSFGAGRDLENFSSLSDGIPSSGTAKPIAPKANCDQNWRHSNDEAFELNPQFIDFSSLPSPEMPTSVYSDSGRATLVLSLKLKRLSFHEPNRIVEMREKVDSVKSRLASLLLDLKKPAQTREIMAPLVSSIVNIAYLRGCVRNHFSNNESQPNESVEERADHEESSHYEEASEEAAKIDCISSSSSMGVEEKVYNYLSTMVIDPDDGDVQDFSSPIVVDNSAQTDTSTEKTTGLLVRWVPTALNSLSGVAPFFEVFGNLSKLEIRPAVDGSTSIFVVYSDGRVESYDKAISRLSESPFGRPWLSSVVIAKLAHEEEFASEGDDPSEPHVMYPFVSQLVNAQERLRQKKKSCRVTRCPMEHNKLRECQSEAELHERSEQEAFVMEEFKDLLSKLNRQKSEENFRVLLRLKQIVEIDLNGTHFLTRSSLKKMHETLLKLLREHIIELSHSQLLDVEKLRSEALIDDDLLTMSLNWQKLLNGEPVEEEYVITELRYSFLMKQGLAKEAIVIANAVGAADLMFRDLHKISEPGTEEYLDAVAKAVEILLKREDGMSLLVYEALDILLLNQPNQRKKLAFELLYSCFFKNPRLFINLIIKFGDVDDCHKVIDYISKQIGFKIWAGNDPIVLEMVRKLIFDMLPQNEDIRGQLFRLGLTVFEATSYDFVDEMVSLCSSAENVISVILSLGCSPQVLSSNALPVVERIIDTLKVKFPSMIAQVIKVILEKMNAFPFLDFICSNGDLEDGLKLIGQIRSNSSQVPKEHVYAMVSKVTKEMLPRLPNLHHEVLSIHISMFAKDPTSARVIEVLSLCTKSEEATKIIRVIEEKTAFGNQWTPDLKAIMNEVCKKCTENWPEMLPAALRIILEHFETDPTWAYHLFKFGSGDDLKKACLALENYISSKGVENLLSVIKYLISKATAHWPEATNDVTRVLPIFFAKAKLSADNYQSLFRYPFWAEHPDCFMQCLQSQWSVLKRLPSKDMVAIGRILVIAAKSNSRLASNVQHLFKGLKGKIDEQIEKLSRVQTSWIRSASQVPPCVLPRNGQFASVRCGGCLELISFLRSENQLVNITVNAQLRRCVTRLLQQVISNDPKRPNVQVKLMDSVKVQFCELNAAENKRRFNRGGCGCIVVTKSPISGSSPKEKIASLTQDRDIITALSVDLQASLLSAVAVPRARPQPSAGFITPSFATVSSFTVAQAVKREASTINNNNGEGLVSKRPVQVIDLTIP